ncbi:MAG: hypothetical protein NT062_23890 [Proteobacteria bacterium]|nr:hypothetical protein [Pseudomonadota bacterium]
MLFCGPTAMALWDEGTVVEVMLSPATFGLAEVDPEGLTGGDAAYNADVLREVLADRRPATDAVVHAAGMTAALGLELLEPGPFTLARLPAQLARARAAIVDGTGQGVLHHWCAVLA